MISGSVGFRFVGKTFYLAAMAIAMMLLPPGIKLASSTDGACTPNWNNEPSMNTARSFLSTAVVGSNLYAITGFNGIVAPYVTVNERFDGTSWSTMAPIPVRHSQSKAASIGTNIYVPGGFNSIEFAGPLDTMQIYSTTTNTWSAGASLPAARSGVAAVGFNGLVYVIAGYNPVGTGHNDVYIYDPATNSYTTGAPMPAGQGNVPGILLNGEIYVVGGGTAPGAHFAYNPTTDAWRSIASLPTSGGTCQPGNGFAFDGEVWVLGCLGLPINQQIWIYNPGTDTWRAGPAYNASHEGSGSALSNGRGFVVGGGPGGGASTVVESVGCETVSVSIDIQFCANPNAFNCKKQGKLPVTIFGSNDLDVNEIDINTVQLCLASNPDQCVSAVGIQSPVDRGNPDTDLGTNACTAGVANPDGFNDVDVLFDATEVASLINCSALPKKSTSGTLIVKGQLNDGTLFQSTAVNDKGIDQLYIQNK